MTTIKVKLGKNPINISGIYKLNYPNGKIYIGQARNVLKRVKEHNSRAKNPNRKNLQLCELAIKKYGIIKEFDLLEEVKNVKNLDEREQYWIKYYNATNKNVGYNILKNGDVSQNIGVNHPNAAFSQDQLNEIINLLIYHPEITLIELGKQFNVNSETIRRINAGISYINPDLSYPLRKPYNHESIKKNSYLDYFISEEELIRVKEALKYDWMKTIEEIGTEYKVPLKVLRDINNGRKFENIGNYIYPIRTKKGILSFQEVIEILELLHTTKLSQSEIGKKYKINRSTVSKINNGITMPIKGYPYPAR